MTTLGLIFNLIILAALAATIFFCFRLSKQFNEMQANRKAFEALIQSLNIASSKAESAVQNIKTMAIGAGDALNERIAKSSAMSQELEIMIEAGDNLANRLQELAEKSRKANVGDDETTPKNDAPRSRAEKELMDALKAKQQS